MKARRSSWESSRVEDRESEPKSEVSDGRRCWKRSFGETRDSDIRSLAKKQFRILLIVAVKYSDSDQNKPLGKSNGLVGSCAGHVI
jgi:hypothetical protein